MSDVGGWYHCGRCGHLFREAEAGRCPKCGRTPVVDEAELAFLQATRDAEPEVKAAEMPAYEPDERHGRRRRKGKEKKGRRAGLVGFVIGWILFLGLAVFIVHVSRQKEGSEGVDERSLSETAEESRALNEAAMLAQQELTSFFEEQAPESRASLVHEPQETLRKMVRYTGPVLRYDELPEWQWESFRGMELPEGKAYVGVVNLEDERRAEFVFLPDEKGERKIDWPNLVRFSEHPWPLFLSGDTPDRGEFRLLARRQAGSSGEQGDVSRLELLEPDPWHPEQAGTSSARVEVNPRSATGRMLREAFEARDAGEGAFGGALEVKDPHAMVRIRARLHRDAEGKITIEELIACHWLSIDAPGFGVPEDEEFE